MNSRMLKIYLAKLIIIPLILLYINCAFILWFPQVFDDIINLVTIYLLAFFVGLDMFIRPPLIDSKADQNKDQYKTIILMIFFLICPIIVIIPFIEHYYLLKDLFHPTISLLLGFVGNFILIWGGLLVLLSRIILGQFGSPKIIIQKDHKLITRGPYRYIRHSMYLGDILLFLGYAIAFSSFISTIILASFMFIIVKGRIELEEKLLLQIFGDDYKAYMQHTKRLIPFIY